MTRPDSITNWLRTALFLPPESSTVAMGIDHLHFFVIITTMIGAAFVGLLATYFVIRYRRRVTSEFARRERAEQSSAAFEWTIATGLFVLFLAWWVIGFMQYIRIRVAPEGTYDLYVTAKQWMWKFSYPNGEHTITTLYVPAGRNVKLVMTSRDVIHSFYVPDFRLKQDVIPGRYTTLWFNVVEPGRHEIFCAEYCGTNHSTMRGEIIALAPDDFARWLGHDEAHVTTAAPVRQEPTVATSLGPSEPESMVRLGREVAAEEGCLRCHTLDGSPHIGPTWAGLYRARVPLQGGGEIVADDAYLTESMMDPLARIHAGYAPVMPSYLGRLRPGETAAIVELIRSLRDVHGQEPSQLAQPGAFDLGKTAGSIGQPPGQKAAPLLQPVAQPPAQPAPSSQGLPPAGAVRWPPIQGDVEVGPAGPIEKGGERK